MIDYNFYFKKIFGSCAVITVTMEDGSTLHGCMYGSDECFDVNDFYQIFVAGEKIYHCYYLLDDLDENMDLSNIDYEHPFRVEERTSEYENLLC